MEIVRALPHGHVLAALGTARRIALDAVLPRRAPQRRRDLALALIVARLLEPAAKLATARMLDTATASHSLGEMLGLGNVTAREIYATLDWLGREQPFIEAQLARRHLKNGALLLYDVTSTYLEGRCCELAQHGYSRDHRGDRPQIVIGLMCAADGCPVAVEVFEGNTADPVTVAAQIDKLKQRFQLQRVVMVGDRGMLTSARIEQTLRPAGLDWITALRARRSSSSLPRAGRCSPRCSMTATWRRSPAPIIPANAWWSARTRCWPKSDGANAPSCWRSPRRSWRASRPACSGRAVRCAAPRRSARRSARCWAGATWPSISRSASPTRRSASPARPSIAAEAALDGIYVVRTNLPAAQSDAAATVRAYKSLQRRARLPLAEDRRSRAASGVSLDRATGARACLALHAGLLSAMAHAPSLAPMLFDEPDPAAREAQRTSPVAKAEPSPAAQRKAARKRTEPGRWRILPVHSFHTLLGDLATLTRNTVCFGGDKVLTVHATPTPVQRRAFSLLGVELAAA